MPCPDDLQLGFGISRSESSAICQMQSYFGIGNNGLGVYRSGTGTLFESGSSLRHVITAAHNLYDHTTSRNARWVSLWFRRRGGHSLATRAALECFVPDEFRESSTALAEHDFGVVRVKPLSRDRFRGVVLGNSSLPGPSPKMLIGYPNEGDCKGKRQPFHSVFTVRPSGPRNYSYDSQETYAGMSGGPLLTRNGRQLTSYGVHIRGNGNEKSRAVRFVPVIRRSVLNWT